MSARLLSFILFGLGLCARVTWAQSPMTQESLPTTDGSIAVGNLTAQIEGEERLAADRPLTVTQRSAIAELLEMRGQVLGRIADYERAAGIAESLVRDAPDDGRSYIVRAHSRSTFHRFREALDDLARAEQLGVNTNHTQATRAAVLQATGRYDEALVLRRLAAKRDIRSLGAEATLAAESGDVDGAERLFVEAQHHYRDVSPFPVAWLYFQQGQMWMRDGNLSRARELFAAAHERLPQYAQVQGHLGEVEAALGNTGRAIDLLRPLAESSDDPDYAAQLARVLGASGSAEEAHRWAEVAARRYDELMQRHPEAFADHAAEFWLGAGGDPGKALGLAEQNVSLRPTPRAYQLLLEAALAAHAYPEACEALSHLRSLPHVSASVARLGAAVRGCG